MSSGDEREEYRARPYTWQKKVQLATQRSPRSFDGYMRRCGKCCNLGITVLLASAARDGVSARPSRTNFWYGTLMSGLGFQLLVAL